MRLLHAAHRPRDAYLAKALAQAGHVVDTAADLTEALLICADGDYDALLLEVADLADAPVRRLAQAAGRGVLVLIADRAAAAERTAALRDGADACFVRPVHVMELEARLSALARLAPGAPTPEGALSLDPASRTARLGDRGLVLPARDYGLLDYMVSHAGEVLSAGQIQEHVWGEPDDPRPDLVRTAMARLRGKLSGAFGQPFLVTLRGHGYRFDAKPPT
jgi:two-component system OmpR family response regulator